MAEAHFLAFAMTYTWHKPRAIIDCHSLLESARSQPVAKLTGPNSPLASVWASIAAACDGDLATWAASGQLIWMPAHKSADGLADLRKSDGTPVTYMEWRANRLADAIAKFGARSALVDPDLMEGGPILKATLQAFKAEAAALGAVTFWANNAPPAIPNGPPQRDSMAKVRYASMRRTLRHCPPTATPSAPRKAHGTAAIAKHARFKYPRKPTGPRHCLINARCTRRRTARKAKRAEVQAMRSNAALIQHIQDMRICDAASKSHHAPWTDQDRVALIKSASAPVAPPSDVGNTVPNPCRSLLGSRDCEAKYSTSRKRSARDVHPLATPARTRDVRHCAQLLAPPTARVDVPSSTTNDNSALGDLLCDIERDRKRRLFGYR